MTRIKFASRVVATFAALAISSLAFSQSVVSIWTGFDNPGFAEVFETCNAVNPEIAINWEVVPYNTYAQKVIASARTNQLPDILLMQPKQPATYGLLGYLAPVDNVAAGLGGTNNFSEDDLYFNTVEGSLWGLPFFSIPHLLFYRSDVLANAGFSLPPVTWNEFQTIAATTTENDFYGYIGFLADPSVGHMVHQWMAAGGADTFGPDMTLTIADEATQEAVQFIADMYDAGHMHPGSVTYSMTDARQRFLNQEGAMTTSSSSFIQGLLGSDLLDQVGVAEIPRNGGTGNYFAFQSFGITKDADIPAATEVIECLYSPENYVRFFELAPAGFIPSTADVVESGQFWDIEKISAVRHLLEPAIRAGRSGWMPGLQYSINEFSGLFDAQNVYQDMLLRVLVGGDTIEQATSWAEEKMAEIMTR